MPTKKSKRSDGRYQVSISVKSEKTGRSIRKYFYGDTQREANDKKKQYLKTLASHVSMDNDSLNVWISTWVKSSSPSASIRKSNAFYAKKLAAVLGDMPIKDIRMIDIRTFAQGVAGMSFSTVKATKRITNRIFEDAVRNRLIPFNPCDGVTWQYASKGTHRALEAWEKRLILENHTIHRAGLWAIIMLFAGLRRGEALALQWEDIDFESQIIHVNKAIVFDGNAARISTTKTQAGIRDVPLLPQLRDALLCYEDRTGNVCRNASGEPIQTQAAFKRGWESWLNAMTNILNGEEPENQGRRSDLKTESDDSRKVFSIRTHDLRHTFCTMLYNAGIGLKEAQYIMGHADIDMTLEVYTHLDKERKSSAANIMNQYAENFDSIKI